MAKIGREKDATTVDQDLDQDLTELLDETERQGIDLMINAEEHFGYPIKCFNCQKPFDTLEDIQVYRVSQGVKVPPNFFRYLYRMICVECTALIKEGLEEGTLKGYVVDYNYACSGALKFIRSIAYHHAQQAGSPVGCARCGKLDPGDEADYKRHRVMVGFPPDLWTEEPIRRLKGMEICPFHARSLQIIPGMITVPIRKYLKRKANLDQQIQDLSKRLDGRRPTRPSGGTVTRLNNHRDKKKK